MTLEDQVAPFDHALRMRIKGFPQETAFHWRCGRDGVIWLCSRSKELVALGEFICAAPTVAEMGEWMPRGAYTAWRRTGWRWTDGTGKLSKTRGRATEAEARTWSLLMALKMGRLVLPIGG